MSDIPTLTAKPITTATSTIAAGMDRTDSEQLMISNLDSLMEQSFRGLEEININSEKSETNTTTKPKSKEEDGWMDNKLEATATTEEKEKERSAAKKDELITKSHEELSPKTNPINTIKKDEEEKGTVVATKEDKEPIKSTLKEEPATTVSQVEPNTTINTTSNPEPAKESAPTKNSSTEVKPTITEAEEDKKVVDPENTKPDSSQKDVNLNQGPSPPTTANVEKEKINPINKDGDKLTNQSESDEPSLDKPATDADHNESKVDPIIKLSSISDKAIDQSEIKPEAVATNEREKNVHVKSDVVSTEYEKNLDSATDNTVIDRVKQEEVVKPTTTAPLIEEKLTEEPESEVEVDNDKNLPAIETQPKETEAKAESIRKVVTKEAPKTEEDKEGITAPASGPSTKEAEVKAEPIGDVATKETLKTEEHREDITAPATGPPAKEAEVKVEPIEDVTTKEAPKAEEDKKNTTSPAIVPSAKEVEDKKDITPPANEPPTKEVEVASASKEENATIDSSQSKPKSTNHSTAETTSDIKPDSTIKDNFNKIVAEEKIDPKLILPTPKRVDSIKSSNSAKVDDELGLTEEEALALVKEEEDAKRAKDEENDGIPFIQLYGSSVSGNRKIKKAQDKMINYFEQYNIEYEFVDLAADEEARKFIKRMNPDSTNIPQLYVDGEFKMEFEEFEELVEYDEVFEALGVDPDY